MHSLIPHTSRQWNQNESQQSVLPSLIVICLISVVIMLFVISALPLLYNYVFADPVSPSYLFSMIILYYKCTDVIIVVQCVISLCMSD